MYSECSIFHRNWFTFGSVIAERVNTAKSPRKANPVFGRNLSSSRRKTVMQRWCLEHISLPNCLLTYLCMEAQFQIKICSDSDFY